MKIDNVNLLRLTLMSLCVSIITLHIRQVKRARRVTSILSTRDYHSGCAISLNVIINTITFL
jgi:hypothetical protein